MKSKTTRDFWKLFQQLPKTIQLRAIMTYRRWQTNPFHPSLHFKPVGINIPIYSVRMAGIRTVEGRDHYLVLDRFSWGI